MGIEQAKIDTLDIMDMSGGLNSNPLSTKMKDNEARDAQNVIWRDQSIYKIPGFGMYLSQIGGVDSTKRVTGIYDFQKRDSTQTLIVTTEDDIRTHNSGAGASIKGALTVSDALHQFASFNDRLLATNYTNAPWTWNGAGNADTLENVILADGGAAGDRGPAQAKFVCTFNARLCFGNYIDNVGGHRPTAVAFSDLDQSLRYDLTNQYWEFETDDAQEITGMRQLKDNLIVYRDNAIGVVSGAGTQSWTVQRDFVKGIGCVAGNSLRTGYLTYEGTLREVHIFLSQEGYKAFDGVNVYNLPVPSQGEDYKCYEYFDSMAKSLFYNAVGEYYRKRNWYFCFYANGGSAVNNRGSIYDYQTNSLWPLVDVNASAAGTRYNTTTKEYELLIGTEDGRILKMSEADESIDGDTELVSDGDMEDVGVLEWIRYAGGTLTKTGVTYFNGAQGLQVGSAGPGQGVSQDVTTVVGKRYRAYCWVISTGGAAGAFQFSVFGGATEITSDYVTHSALVWVRSSIEFTATTTTSTLVIQDRRGAGGTMVVDDLSCRNSDINSYWESKDFDFGSEHEVKILREFVPFASEQGDWNVQFTLTFDKGSSATTDNLNLLSGAAVWGEFLWGSVEWGAREEINDDLVNITQEAFRTMRIKFANPYGGQAFNINKILMKVKSIGKRWFHNAD